MLISLFILYVANVEEFLQYIHMYFFFEFIG